MVDEWKVKGEKPKPTKQKFLPPKVIKNLVLGDDGEESEKPEEDLSGSECLHESDGESNGKPIGNRGEPAATDSDSDSILSKRTLALGEPASSDVESVSVEGEPDSQVSSGWLGRAYNRESRTQKKAKVKQDHKEQLAKVRCSNERFS